MFGLNMLVSLLRAPNDIQEENRYKVITTVLDACVPIDKRAEVMEQVEELEKQIWWDLGWKIFGQVIGNTFTLGLGFVVHAFTS
jgi:hypothetical protein